MKCHRPHSVLGFQNHFLSARYFPKSGRSIRRPGGEVLSIRTESHLLDNSLMPHRPTIRLARGHVPQTGGGVKRAGGQQFPIGTKGQGKNRSLVSNPGEQLTGGGMPQACGTATAAVRQHLSIGPTVHTTHAFLSLTLPCHSL